MKSQLFLTAHKEGGNEDDYHQRYLCKSYGLRACKHYQITTVCTHNHLIYLTKN